MRPSAKDEVKNTFLIHWFQRNHSAKSLADSIGCEKNGKLDPEFLDPGESDKMMYKDKALDHFFPVN